MSSPEEIRMSSLRNEINTLAEKEQGLDKRIKWAQQVNPFLLFLMKYILRA